jgi:ketosteroid isomerase-like protein
MNISIASDMHRLFESFNRGDAEELAAFIGDSVALRIPGESTLAGTYLGLASIASLFRKRMELATGSLVFFGKDVAVSEHHGVLLYAAEAQRDGKSFLSHELVVAGVDAGRISILFLYVFEWDAFDRFWT